MSLMEHRRSIQYLPMDGSDPEICQALNGVDGIHQQVLALLLALEGAIEDGDINRISYTLWATRGVMTLAAEPFAEVVRYCERISGEESGL